MSVCLFVEFFFEPSLLRCWQSSTLVLSVGTCVSVGDRNLESYQETAWSSMSELEHQLRQLEMNVAQQFGEVDSADDDDEDERRCGDEVTAADGDREDEDYVLDDSLYCIACKKAFKSDKA